jgi:hypothetical protein
MLKRTRSLFLYFFLAYDRFHSNGDDWITVALWATPILLVDEILKAIGRRVNKEKNEKLAELRAS